ncbi:MAG: sulfatase-like hydrolase/transferase [Fimbriimonadaceae bacterium]|nr:sulfatase-like hydrolase/transferase [Fimbriimonadaceae bacterium]
MRRPNILLLYTDQQRWDAVGCNGNTDLQTPHLDALAAAGTNCTHCFVQNPVCMPSRVSFLTGRYPSSLGITHMGVPVPPDTLTLPRMLRPYGYRTANLGKLHFQPHANRDHRAPHPDYGFDELVLSDEPGVYEDAYRAWVRAMAPDQLPHLSVGLPPATAVWYRQMGLRDSVPHPSEGGRFDTKGPRAFPGDERYTHSAFVGEMTCQFLRQQDPRTPFLCIAGFYSPHSPWVAPQRWLEAYDPARLRLPSFPPEVEARRGGDFDDHHLRGARQGYYAMVSEVDAQVGRILATLEQQGLAEETLVVFTSDHGDWLGEHLRYGKGYPGDDGCTRVPLLLRWPGGGQAGSVVDHLVEHVDVLPTLLQAAAVQPPPSCQGRPLQDLLAGGAARGSALCEHHGWKSLRTATHRYLVHADGRELLYDLSAEWGDYRDVAADPGQAAALSEHRGRLAVRLLQQEQPLERTWPY